MGAALCVNRSGWIVWKWPGAGVVYGNGIGLGKEPVPPNSELQRELAGRFRLKIDGWRILYKIDETDRVVTVLAIRPRNPSTYLDVP